MLLNLKFQMKEWQSEKLTEHFVEPYKVKKIVSTNSIKLELLESIKIYPVVNISRVKMYKDQVEGQKKECPLLVVTEEKKEYEM